MTDKKLRIAVCGKGGVGKTAFIAMLTQALINRGGLGNLLVIDADPAVGLPSALGVKVEKTIGQIRETIIDAAKNREREWDGVIRSLDYLVMESMVEADDFCFLAMGRTDGKGCFCSVNDILHKALDVLTDKFDIILIDGEAGLEQINRQVASSLDYLMVLTDASNRGRETVGLIKHMVIDEKVIDCRNVGVIINRVPMGIDQTKLISMVEQQGLPVWGVIPLDETIVHYDLTGKSLRELPEDNPAVWSVKRVAEILG